MFCGAARHLWRAEFLGARCRDKGHSGRDILRVGRPVEPRMARCVPSRNHRPTAVSRPGRDFGAGHRQSGPYGPLKIRRALQLGIILHKPVSGPAVGRTGTIEIRGTIHDLHLRQSGAQRALSRGPVQAAFRDRPGPDCIGSVGRNVTEPWARREQRFLEFGCTGPGTGYRRDRHLRLSTARGRHLIYTDCAGPSSFFLHPVGCLGRSPERTAAL